MIFRKTLLPKQMEFIRSADRQKAFVAGIGSGKTLVASWWAVSRAQQKRSVIVTEPTFGMCKRNLIPTFEKVFDDLEMKSGRDYRLNKTDLEYSFPCGGRIYLCSGDNPDRLRGINAHDGLIDEFGSQPTDDLHKILVGRLRESRDSQIRFTGTPSPIKWVRDLIQKNDSMLIRQSTIENFYLPEEYVKSLKDTYGEGSPWYRQEVLGELVDFSTGLFSTDKINLIGALHPLLPRVVRAWDFAHTDEKKGKKSDFTASVKMSTDGKKWVIHDVTHFKGQWSAIRDRVIQTMVSDGRLCTQVIENSQGGMVVRSDLMSCEKLYAYNIRAVNAISDKVSRSFALSSKMAQGLIHSCNQPWFRPMADEFNAFGPSCEHDDRVDACAHAFNSLEKTGSIETGNINI